MAEHRVIQDSDDSEAEISDAATSIDPLQDSTSSKAVDTHEHNVEVIAGNDSNGDDAQGTSQVAVGENDTCLSGGSGDLTVNFDSFLVTQSNDGQVTASQQQREQAWIGGVNPDPLDDRGMILSDMGTSHSDPPFSAVSPSKTMLKRGRTITSLDELGPGTTSPEKKPKRRKTTNQVGSSFSVDNSTVMDPAAPAELDTRNCRLSETVHSKPQPSARDMNESDVDFSENQTLEHEELHAADDVPEDGQNPSTKVPNRSKSIPIHSSPHDTEPMSSHSFSRARRAKSVADPQSSYDPIADPPTLSEPVQVSSAAGDRESRVPDQEHDFEVEHHGGLLQQLYKPRPSRSRSKRTDLVYIDGGHGRGADPGFAVVVPQTEYGDCMEKSHEVNEENVDTEDAGISAQEKHESKNVPERHAAVVSAPVEELSDTPQNVAKLDAEVDAPNPKKPQKKSKKRKAASAPIKEAVDPEAEEDVILVDEGRVPETSLLNTVHMGNGDHDADDAKAEPQNCQGETEQVNTAPTTAVPKKRGRKKKKTAADDLSAAEPVKSAHPEPENAAEPNANPVEKEDKGENGNQGQHGTVETDIPASTPRKENAPAPETPQTSPIKTPSKPADTEKGPDKHSPIQVKNNVSYRVGLSRNARIAPLLKVVRK